VRVLCLNAGSSSLKAAGFDVEDHDGDQARVVSERIERVGDGKRADISHVAALDVVAGACERAGFTPDVVAHRIVHGGPNIVDHVVVDDVLRAELEEAISFAPLHLPAALAVLDAACVRYRGRAQVACFDTVFHRQLTPASRRLPIPAELDASGVRRYGFHGLSYEYLVHRLGSTLGRRAVLAHLGNGASLAAVHDGIGVDTTMGFTPAGGLVMGTRTGDLDPGVLVHLLRTRGLDADQLEQFIDRECGLFGLSGRSADVRDLLDARDGGDLSAALALEMYETVAAKHIAACTTVLGGMDTLVFTAGIGENAGSIRAGIARRLAHLGVTIDDSANDANAAIISSPNAPVTVQVVPTDEELMMARHAERILTAMNSEEPNTRHGVIARVQRPR
jgi:acetate kinase